MRYENLRGAQVSTKGHNGPETVLVMKQECGYTRYRFRIASEDITHAELRKMEGFKVRWSSNMTEKDIEKVTEKWGHLIIKEILQ